MFRVLAAFFTAVAITELGDALGPSLLHVPTRIAINAIWIVGVASVFPLFWLYIWKLTESNTQWPKYLWLHAVTPGIAFVIFLLVFTLTDSDRRNLFTDADGDISNAAFAIGAAFGGYAMFIVTLQWGSYLYISARRLFLFRAKLKDVFASSEGKELRWATAVIGVCAVYWMFGSTLLVLELVDVMEDPPEIPVYALNLLVGFILLVWGLRQRRPLHRPEADIVQPEQTKYAKSALTAEMAARIATKLTRAMTEDRLHLDPNLSLWSLSKHIGVSDNYVSQVLNEEIGQNFFDFVNGHRVNEAKERLTSSNETILSIAYEIGFNSRSSFYTAFKKSTGQTPTAFRSQTVRPD